MTAETGGLDVLLVGTTFLLGLRHGVDWDHISAITDLTGAEPRRRRAGKVAILYALGHGAAVLALGALAVAAGERLPTWIDPLMERVVGATLLVLAVAVARTAWSSSGRPRSRGLLLLDALGALRARLRRTRRTAIRHAHDHDHDARHGHVHAAPVEPEGHTVRTKHRHEHVHEVALSGYGSGAAFTVGVLHGVGAETGTQAVVLVGAAHATGMGAGLLVVGAFVLGVVVTTALLAVGTAAGWAVMGGHVRAVRTLTIVAAVASGTVGATFLLGAADRLPSILGG